MHHTEANTCTKQGLFSCSNYSVTVTMKNRKTFLINLLNINKLLIRHKDTQNSISTIFSHISYY